MEKEILTEQQFNSYLEKYRRLIYKVARIYCQDADEREDLVQEILLQLWYAFPKYNQQCAESTWTYRIALNVSISYLRKTSARQKKAEIYRQEKMNSVTANDNLDQLELLYRFIEKLKSIDRAIILLYLEGCKNQEISEVMGLSISNISTKKQRIVAQLKKYFETHKLNKQ